MVKQSEKKYFERQYPQTDIAIMTIRTTQKTKKALMTLDIFMAILKVLF